jgi:hypothetical protein
MASEKSQPEWLSKDGPGNLSFSSLQIPDQVAFENIDSFPGFGESKVFHADHCRSPYLLVTLLGMLEPEVYLQFFRAVDEASMGLCCVLI